MKRQPTLIEGKPKADMGLLRQNKRRRPAVADFDLEDSDPPINIDLQKKIDLLDLIEFPFEIEEFETFNCLICGQITNHTTPYCPYLEFVPHNVTLPPGIDRLCTCCDKIGGHPGKEWVGYARPMRCRDCGIIGEHRTGDSDCPAKGARRETAPTVTATPSVTAPSETAPTVTATPSVTAPSKTAPTETASPSETAPRETVPTETATPSVTAPSKTAQTAPRETVPTETASCKRENAVGKAILLLDADED